MASDSDSWIFWLFAAGIGAWLLFFGGWDTVQGWFGQNTYESRRASLMEHVKRNRVGNSADVYLVKHGFGGPEQTALIFGYMDDWAACSEIAQAYMARFPSDTYSCQIAN